jgi:hypothetical protein
MKKQCSHENTEKKGGCWSCDSEDVAVWCKDCGAVKDGGFNDWELPNNQKEGQS